MTAPELPEFLAKLIDDIAVREGYVPGTFTVTPSAGSNPGDNYQGIVLRVSVVGERIVDGVSRPNEQLAFICKQPPDDLARREMFHSGWAFKREIHLYTEILPVFENFQKDAGLTRDVGFFRYPKCYGSIVDDANSNYAIVLSDLRPEGCEMWNRIAKLDFQHASKALSELGKFHALSFVMRDQRPDVLAKLRALKPDSMIAMLGQEHASVYWNGQYAMARDTLGEDEIELRSKMDKLSASFAERMCGCLNGEASEPYGVLSHGDFWNNNMLYKYGEDSKVPESAYLIDWQLSHFSSPAIDLAYFMFSSTEKELRQQHFWDLIRVYHDRLTETVRALGSDPEQLFSFENLRDQMNRFMQHGLLMGAMLVQVITATVETLPDFDKMANQIADNQVVDLKPIVADDNLLYKQRMSDVIRDFFGLGFDLVD